MFENVIHFSAHKDIVAQKKLNPVPIKTNIPEWFKKLNHNNQHKTVKGCVPFLETLTTGYLLKTPQQFLINHNEFKEDSRVTELQIPDTSFPDKEKKFCLYNLNYSADGHNPQQIKGSPLAQKNLDVHVQKILNPWYIKTAPGYSCLFLPPLNNTDSRFSIIPGIVNTDKFESRINFPFIVNGDKYPHLKDTIEEGTPYVQVIPFKRNSWKMKINSLNDSNINKKLIKFGFLWKLIHSYKTIVWEKISWK